MSLHQTPVGMRFTAGRTRENYAAKCRLVHDLELHGTMRRVAGEETRRGCRKRRFRRRKRRGSDTLACIIRKGVGGGVILCVDVLHSNSTNRCFGKALLLGFQEGAATLLKFLIKFRNL